MSVKNMQPLNMQEAKKILGSLKDDSGEKKKKTEAFIKRFSKIKPDKTEELKKELVELGLLKIKEENIVKIIDLLPEDDIDLNKIFTDVALDENETNKILETIKKYK